MTTPKPPKRSTLYVDGLRPAAVPEAIQSFGTIGDSQYDSEASLGVGNIEQVNYLRAVKQGKLATMGNAFMQTALGIPLGILENAGYLAELPEALFGKNPDYTNSLVEAMTQGRESIAEKFPMYREDPGATWDIGDSAWWIQNGQGLAESIGEFFATGAGVGGGLGKGAKALNSVIKSQMIQKGITGVATLGTAGTLAYTEGAMSGARVYEDVYKNAFTPIEEGGLGYDLGNPYDQDKAKVLASSAASKTVKLNTVINTVLNISSITPLMKSYSNLDDVYKLGLGRRAGEALPEWSKRLDEASLAGLNQSAKSALASEAIQEGLEEQVNVFAEKEGRIKGKLQLEDSSSYLESFGKSAFSDEGALNFFLGAIGGVAQTGALNYLPYRNYTDVNGDVKRTSTNEIVQIQNEEKLKNYLTTLKDDITTITSNQKALQEAVAKGDIFEIDDARKKLFDVSVLKSIREGVADEFVEEMNQIASVDNTKLDEQGTTEAMRLGYANNPQDNKYKETAVKKAAQIPELQKEYSRLNNIFDNKFAADKVFSLHVANKTKEETVNELTQQYSIVEQGVSNVIPDPAQASVVLQAAKVEALRIAKNTAKALNIRENNKYSQALKANLDNAYTLNEASLKSNPGYKQIVAENKANIDSLVPNLSNVLYFQEELKQDKRKYNDAINNKNEVIKAVEKERDDLFKLIKQVQDAQKAEESKVKQVEVQEDAKQENKVKKSKYISTIGDFEVQSTSKGFVVLDREAGVIVNEYPTLEEAEREAKYLDQKSKRESKKEDTPVDKPIKPTTKETTEVVENKTEITSYQHNPEGVKKEKELLDSTIKESNKLPKDQINHIKYSNAEGKYMKNISTSIAVGDKVTLKIEKNNPYSEQAIGIYKGNLLIGYVAEKGTEPIRDLFKANPQLEVETTISDKSTGELIKVDKKKTGKNLPSVTKVAILKEGSFHTGVKRVYDNSKLINKVNEQGQYVDKAGNALTEGGTYAILPTPNGKEVAVLLDTDKLSEEVADSIFFATAIYTQEVNLEEPEVKKVIDTIFKKYNLDLTSTAGYQEYVSYFMGKDLWLTDRVVVAEENAKTDKSTNHYFLIDKEKIKFFQPTKGVVVKKKDSEGKPMTEIYPRELYPTMEPNVKEDRLQEFREFLSNYRYNNSLEKLQSNKAVSLPLIKQAENTDPYVEDMSFKSYTEFVKNITTSVNLGEVDLGNGETGYFTQPNMYFDTSFLGEKQKETYGEVEKKSAETVTLQPKKKSPFRTMTSVEMYGVIKEDSITDTTVENNKRYCT